MTAPANIPDIGTINDKKQTTRPFKSVAFTHGGSTLDLTTALVPCATEIFCTGTGNLTAQLAGDSSTQTYAVTAGTVLYGLFVYAASSSTADGIFRQ